MSKILTVPGLGSYQHSSLRQGLQLHLHPKKGLIDQSTDKRRVALQNGEFPTLRNVNGVLGWDFVGQTSASIHVLDDEGLIEDVVAGKPRTVFIRMSGANATSMCWGQSDRVADVYMWWRGGDQQCQWRGTNSWTEFTLPGNKFTDALPLFHETEWNGSAYLNRVSLSDNPLTEVSFGGDPRERFAFNVYGRDCRTSAAWDNTTTLHEVAVWNRVLTPAEKRVLAEDPDALIDRTPLYIPRPVVPTPDFEANLTQSESLTADLTVELVPDADLAADLSQAESLTANLTVDVPGDVSLAADLSQAESLTADLTIEAPGDVVLAADLSQAESLTANLTVDVPGEVALVANLSQSEALSADLTIELPAPDLAADLSQSETLTALLTIEGAVPVSAVHYRGAVVLPYYRANSVLPHYRG